MEYTCLFLFYVGTHIWVSREPKYVELKVGHVCGTIKKPSGCLTIVRKVLSCGINGHTAPLISQESSTKVTLRSLSASSPVCLFSRFLCGEQLHRILLPTTAHTPFNVWHKPFYNRPSDCCFHLAYSVALLIPITIRAIAPESVGMVTVVTLPYDSPVCRTDLSIGFRPLWIPKTLTSPISRRYV